jgi:GNAT superfamily N-acetyltransferase
MTENNLTTRLMVDDDLPEVLAMVHALASHHGDLCTLSIENLAHEAKEWHRIIVACVGDDVVGYASLLPMGQLQFGARGMDMHHLFVAEDSRRCGVGRALIAASIALCKDLSCKYLTVGTHPENASAALVYLAFLRSRSRW